MNKRVQKRKLSLPKLLLLLLLLWNCYLTFVVNDLVKNYEPNVKVPVIENNETLDEFIVLDLENILKRN